MSISRDPRLAQSVVDNGQSRKASNDMTPTRSYAGEAFMMALETLSSPMPSLDALEAYVPPSELDLQERILATQRQKDLAIQEMPVKIQALTDKYVDRITQEQTYYSRATEDIKGGNDVRPGLPRDATSERLKKTSGEADVALMGLYIAQDQTLRAAAMAQNREIRRLEDMEREQIRKLEDLQVNLKTAFPRTIQEFKVLKRTYPDHAAQVARYLNASDDAARKSALTAANKYGGRHWNDQDITVMRDEVNSNDDVRRQLVDFLASIHAHE